MSMHKIPLSPLEEEGLTKHKLPIGVPSQLADAFRQGMAFALSMNEDKPEDEVACAEEWLDHFAAKLTLEQTAFDCIGDYIKAVCEHLMTRVEQENKAARVQNAKLMAVTDTPGGIEKLRTVLTEALPMDDIKKFLNVAAGEGYVFDGVDAADLYMKLFPEGPERN